MKVFLVGHHGNQFYPSSWRLFSSFEYLKDYLESERQKSIYEAKRDKQHGKWILDNSKTLEEYATRLVHYKVYEITLDDPEENVKNISRPQLRKLLKNAK
jgi:hypothetical protein